MRNLLSKIIHMPKSKGSRIGRGQIWHPFTDYNMLTIGRDPWDWAIRFMPHSAFTSALDKQIGAGNFDVAMRNRLSLEGEKQDNYLAELRARTEQQETDDQPDGGVYEVISELNSFIDQIGRHDYKEILKSSKTFTGLSKQEIDKTKQRFSTLSYPDRDTKLTISSGEPTKEEKEKEKQDKELIRVPGTNITVPPVSVKSQMYFQDVKQAQALLDEKVRAGNLGEAETVIRQASLANLDWNLDLRAYKDLLALQDAQDQGISFRQQGSRGQIRGPVGLASPSKKREGN